MAWKDTRATTRTIVATARTVAHADDAKSRAHEASSLTGRGFPTKLVAGGAAVGLAVVGFVAFSSRGDDQRDKAALATATAPSTSSSPTDQEPSPAEVLAESQPGGEWRAQTFGRSLVTRGGTTQPQTYKNKPVTWTFTSTSCAADQCGGAISSTSGNTFDYVWNGRTLKVTSPELSWKDPKEACVDQVTGQPMPIEESAAVLSYHQRVGSLTGSAAKLTGPVVTTVHYKFFGTCEPGDKDAVKYIEEIVIRRAG
jgi:hypothetical protein